MVRAKFKCVEKTEGEQANSYKFNPVIEGSEENKQFFMWTPGGRIELTSTNKNVDFIVGKEYYVDFTQAE